MDELYRGWAEGGGVGVGGGWEAKGRQYHPQGDNLPLSKKRLPITMGTTSTSIHDVRWLDPLLVPDTCKTFSFPDLLAAAPMLLHILESRYVALPS